MDSGRLEAFSDGVLAIVITVMVLELRVPDAPTLQALRETTGIGLLTYVLSFLYVGIYWNNHHHMLKLTDKVTGGILWANLNLLFWLTLIPFTMRWMDEFDLSRTPVVVYGIDLLAAAIAYYVLQTTIIRSQGEGSVVAAAIGRDLKGKASPVLYLLGIASAWLNAWVAVGFFVLVAVIWLVPDRRLERAVST